MSDPEAVIETTVPVDDLEWSIGSVLEALDLGEVFEQVDTIRLYGWMVRCEGGDVGVYLPDPAAVMADHAIAVKVIGKDADLVHRIATALVVAPRSPLHGLTPTFRP